MSIETVESMESMETYAVKIRETITRTLDVAAESPAAAVEWVQEMLGALSRPDGTKIEAIGAAGASPEELDQKIEDLTERAEELDQMIENLTEWDKLFVFWKLCQWYRKKLIGERDETNPKTALEERAWNAMDQEIRVLGWMAAELVHDLF